MDTDTVTTTYSVYANEFKPTATILHQAEAPYYQAYANITFVNPAGELDVKRTNPNSAGYSNLVQPQWSSGAEQLGRAQ
ncbi:hypothetical protein [Paenibacillus sp. JMULE4]|uniref:hypothetical protein n=1 Tax=Paenibacillus sp. JMULE4 TaxID=2518342 RepID=UPI0015750001|nr:hypothetical protein [Paenibacillus sp. JMULE4]